jgi:hypothetical protein
MANYVLTFRAPKGRVPAAEDEARWHAWLAGIGGQVTDPGNRIGQVRDVGGGLAGLANAVTASAAAPATAVLNPDDAMNVRMPGDAMNVRMPGDAMNKPPLPVSPHRPGICPSERWLPSVSRWCSGLAWPKRAGRRQGHRLRHGWRAWEGRCPMR